jgi:hypothetical protein
MLRTSLRALLKTSKGDDYLTTTRTSTVVDKLLHFTSLTFNIFLFVETTGKGRLIANAGRSITTTVQPESAAPTLVSSVEASTPNKGKVSFQEAQDLYASSLENDDFFDVRKLVTVQQLFDNRVHLGHKVGSLNPYMRPYLYGERLGVCIFDLDQTVKHLQDALNFAAHIAFRSGVILFVNNSKDVSPIPLLIQT